MNGRSLKSTSRDPLFEKLRPEPFRLLAKLLHERGAVNALGKSRVVFDVGGDHQLSAGRRLFFRIGGSIDQERFRLARAA